MLTTVKNILKKLRLFNQLKYSGIGNLYYKWFNRPQHKAALKELAFYQSFLPSCKLIFDIGANDGHKTIVFKKLAGKVVACDPDPHNIEILGIRFGNSKNVTIEPFAITDYIGECNFYIQQPGSPLNSVNPQWKTILEEDNNNRWIEPVKFSEVILKAKTTTLDTLITKHGIPDFIKIDVEGNEQNVLKGLSHTVNYISFEVLLPEFLNEATECLNLLLSINKNYHFNYSVDETTMLQEFLNYDNFTSLLHTLTIPHLEIIAAIK
ncbi:FkbM family methyltransferase [Ferruginibacter sp. SUN106]|uniref:FkbM family methyltransferase n=1 Tax=Ferruginibacter sp. SUN106 TaxID=2978348 RepID=UPI003D36A5E7